MADTEPTRPLPVPDLDTEPYWKGMNDHELRFQRCAQCEHVQFLPGPMCSGCQSFDLEWFTSSGKGTVYSWSGVEQHAHPAFEPPYTVLLVEMDEGPRVIAQLRGAEETELEIGMPVHVAWDDSEPEQSFAVFELD